MNNSGIYSLGDFTVGAAGTTTGTAITDLEGVTALSIQARFVYGSSGGTTVKLYVQTSFDQGTTYCDVACIVFGTSNENQMVNLSGLTPKTTALTPTDASLSDDTVIDGFLGDRFRAKIVVAGTYAGSPTLSVRICAR